MKRPTRQPPNALTTGGHALQRSHRLAPEQHPALVYLAGLAESGRRTQRAALARSVHALIGDCGDPASRCDCPIRANWSRLRFSHVVALRTKLRETLSSASVNKHLAAVRGTLRQAWRLGQLAHEEYARVKDVEGLRSKPLPRGRALTPRERAKLYAVCAADPNRAAGTRDAALLALLDAAGLRRTAVAALKRADVDLASQVLRVVAGKGGKDREVPLSNGGLDAVADWIALRGDAPGPLLYAVRKGGEILKRGISPQTVRDVVEKRRLEAALAPCSPHDFRRSLISDLLDAGADLAVVSQLVGHENVQTTAKYDRRDERAKARAVALRAVPYIRTDEQRRERRRKKSDE